MTRALLAYLLAFHTPLKHWWRVRSALLPRAGDWIFRNDEQPTPALREAYRFYRENYRGQRSEHAAEVILQEGLAPPEATREDACPPQHAPDPWEPAS